MTPKEAVEAGFKQTSRKFRHIARLKPGTDPLQVIKQTDPIWYSHLVSMIEGQLLRCSSSDVVERHEFATDEEMNEFRRCGGDVA